MMAQEPIVTVVPANFPMATGDVIHPTIKRRAAGYARVSTEFAEQKTSYDAQVDYFTTYIKSRPDLEFITIYTDEGASGTSTKKRTGFTQMVADGLASKFDVLYTKSVSRFARNTIDTLTVVREFKKKGIEIFFRRAGHFNFGRKRRTVPFHSERNFAGGVQKYFRKRRLGRAQADG